jgi:hypothetical protein
MLSLPEGWIIYPHESDENIWMIKRPTTVDPEEMVSTYENFPKMTYRGHR